MRWQLEREVKELIKETVENMKHLDKDSLLLIKSGAELLKSRDILDQKEQEEEVI